MQQDTLGYMLHQLMFIIDRQSDEALHAELGMGFSQFKILMASKHNMGHKQNDIARHLGQTEASVSRQIKLMKAEGLLSVRVDPENRRARSIILTDKGTDIGRRCIEVLERTHSSVFGSLSFSEQKLMRELLDRLIIKACNKNK